MVQREIEGGWIQGWPGRKRLEQSASTDAEGRVIGARTPILDLEGLITPTDACHVVAQLGIPEPIHPDDYRLSLSGRIERPCDLSLEELRRLPGRSVRAVVECAGNDDVFFDYMKAGEGASKPSLRPEGGRPHWREVAADADDGVREELLDRIPGTCFVSSGEWTGVSLATVLKAVGLGDEAVAVRVEGWDEGRPDPLVVQRSTGMADLEVFDPGVIHFDKGLPLEKALDPDTILAWSHNGEYLRHVHGAPVRLVVPGWSGNWWVKWLHGIEVMDRMPDCYYQTHYFVHAKSLDDPDRRPTTALGVKSLIVEPRDDDSPLPRGEHAIRGLAWSGEGSVTRVEVSTDGGVSWRDAHVEKNWDRWLWVRWSHRWTADRAGNYALMARATDERGRVQPQTEWNYQRKHFDGIVPVDVTVA